MWNKLWRELPVRCERYKFFACGFLELPQNNFLHFNAYGEQDVRATITQLSAFQNRPE